MNFRGIFAVVGKIGWAKLFGWGAKSFSGVSNPNPVDAFNYSYTNNFKATN